MAGRPTQRSPSRITTLGRKPLTVGTPDRHFPRRQHDGSRRYLGHGAPTHSQSAGANQPKKATTHLQNLSAQQTEGSDRLRDTTHRDVTRAVRLVLDANTDHAVQLVWLGRERHE